MLIKIESLGATASYEMMIKKSSVVIGSKFCGKQKIVRDDDVYFEVLPTIEGQSLLVQKALLTKVKEKAIIPYLTVFDYYSAIKDSRYGFDSFLDGLEHRLSPMQRKS